jgi:putative ATP-binding cassette transporter
MFRAIASLWPWGSGSIGLPSAEGVKFMSQRPYLPLGPLREALTYPRDPKEFPDDDIVKACHRVGLAHLTTELDRSADWDRELASDELQRLAFARLLLHKPKWACVNEPLDSLDPGERAEILTVFDRELADAAVISVGHHDLREGFSKRVLHLVRYAQGPRLTPLASISPTPPKSEKAPA